MEKTRKERIVAANSKKLFGKKDLSNAVYKRGTAVLSTTLLVSLLAFPSFSASASANDLANSSSKELEENLKNNPEVVTEGTTEGTEVAKESETSIQSTEKSSDTTENAAEDKAIEKEQKIQELKILLTAEVFDTLIFEELDMEDIDELIETALDVKNDDTVNSEEAIEATITKMSIATNEEKIEATYALTEETVETDAVVEETSAAVNEGIEPSESAVEAEASLTTEIVEKSEEVSDVDKAAEQAELDKAEADKVKADQAAADKAELDQAASEQAELEQAAADKAKAEQAAADKAKTDQAAADKAKAEQAADKAKAEQAADKAKAEQAAADKAKADKAAADKAKADKAAADKAKADKAAADKAKADKAAADKAKAETAKLYTIKSGDTLNKIAKANGLSVAELKKMNNLSSDLIHPGQVLAVNKAAVGAVQTVTTAITSNKAIEKMSNAEFVEFIGAYAAEVAPKNDLYASLMIAQAALESGWGSSKLSSSPNHNLFGIKGSYNGQTATMYTSEWSASGGWIYIPQNFKKYPSHAESLQDNANLLKNGTNWDSNFYSGAWKSNSTSVYDATAWLQGRYATDPSYASKLNNIINSYNLTRFDSGYTGPVNPNPGSTGSDSSSSEKPNTNTTASSYTVKNGDTLWAIANRMGVSVANVKSWNNLKSDTIYIGQKLTIKGGTGSTNNNSTPNTSTPSNTTTSSYTVKSGDTLWGVASSKGVSVANLKSWNNLKSDTIYIDQKLTIKGGTGSTNNNSTPNTSTPSNTATSSYTVKSGDTLWGVANSSGVSVANLKSWNNLTSDTIYIGQKLTIKGGTGSTNNNSTPNTSTPSNTATSTYTVKNGDTLWGVANSKGVSVANLKSWNNLTSDTIFVGQNLTIKGGTGSTNTTPTTSTPTNTATSTYTVKSGDTLWEVASSNGVSVANLKSWNNLTSDTIFVGQKLTIKGGTNSSSANTAPNISTPSNTVTSSYTVKNGDSLWGVASSNGVSVANLKSWNNLTSDTIYIGQNLTIKGGTGSTNNNSTPNTSTPSNTTTSSYTVKSGDTLWGVASSKGVSVANLKSWNNLTSDTIMVGQNLTIKGGSTATTNSNKTDATVSNLAVSYTIKSGDTLSAISSKYGVSLSDLKSWNKLSTDTIYVGQTLTVKVGNQANSIATAKTPTVPVPTTNKNTSGAAQSNHIVKSGDTLWGIANSNGVSVADLKSWNDLNSDSLSVGQNLTLITSVKSDVVTKTPEQLASYTVVRDDSLWAIANKIGVSVASLKEWNYLKSDVIFVGQTLLIK
ncbi:LysM peptidoglycan-binding domain-containing protein [Carnobacterium antarcticum]|uniref:LysM peptidoglycan-binding domain-containing protein n=1 Tax=Carnobacterium antarcticum TaxID=2126436 RepID=UPI00360621C9